MRGVRGCESIVRYTAKSRRYEIGYDGRSIHRPCHIFYFHHNAYLDPSLSLLYGDLDPSEASRIANELQTLDILNELSGGGTQVLVPANRVGEARIAMAELGLPAGGNIGYEAFNKEEGLGTSNFVQNIRALTALQGELGRTIASISSVKSAKVLLVCLAASSSADNNKSRAPLSC